MDLKEEYKKRYEDLRFHQSRAYKTLNRLHEIKEEMIKEAMEKAKLEAEKSFTHQYGEEENMAEYVLQNANTDLVLLRCPETNSHRHPEGQYYRCEICGYVWDDTSPAHF